MFFPWRDSLYWAKVFSFLRFHDHTHTPHSVGLPWKGDEPDADLFLTTHDSHNRQTSMVPARFEPANPSSERPKIHALGHVATGIARCLQ